MEKQFSILDKDGVAIDINVLDQEAADFWNVPLDNKHYAKPKESYETISWYDCIGWTIAYRTPCYQESWANVVNDIICNGMQLSFIAFNRETKTFTINDSESICKKHQTTLAFYKPYFDLINHWAEKGYQPKQVIS